MRANVMSAHSVRFTHFDTTDARPQDSFELWREVLSGAYDLTAARKDRPSLRIDTGMWEAERLVMGFCRCEAARVDRRGAHIGRAGRFLKLRWFSSGQVRLIHGEESTVIGPGAIHVIDQSREIVEISSAHEQRSVFVPHAVLDYDPGRRPVWASLPLDTPAGRVLAAAFESFFRELPLAEAPQAAIVEAGFIGLLRGLVSGALETAAEAPAAAARAQAMMRFLDRNLADPTLGVESLLGTFGASRATVFRDFAASGGVQRYILERRLERAFADLAGHPGARGIVRAVAESWGFASESHFSKLFRQRYGMAPGEAVGLKAVATEPGPRDTGRPDRESATADPDPAALARVYQRIAGLWG